MVIEVLCELVKCLLGDGLAGPGQQVEVEEQVVVAQHLPRQVFPHAIEMAQVGSGVAGADLAGALGVQGAGVPLKALVFDLKRPLGAKHLAIAGVAGGQHAVEQVHPLFDGVQDIQGVPTPIR